MLLKQNVDGEVLRRTHIGPQRGKDEILAEIMAEIEAEEKKFKDLADMHACRWDQAAYLNPPPRMNSHNPVVKPSTISASSHAAATVSPAPVSPAVTDATSAAACRARPTLASQRARWPQAHCASYA
jgi:hypothetical protein